MDIAVRFYVRQLVFSKEGTVLGWANLAPSGLPCYRLAITSRCTNRHYRKTAAATQSLRTIPFAHHPAWVFDLAFTAIPRRFPCFLLRFGR
jgi:hypothetical protein